MIFCITLFQRAASRVKKRQSGAEDPRLRAACVNRTPTPSAVMYGRFAHVTGLRMYVRWEWLPCAANEVVPRRTTGADAPFGLRLRGR